MIAARAATTHSAGALVMNVAISTDLSRVAAAENDGTKWAVLIPGLSSASTAWLNAAKTPIDTVARAATMLAAVEGGNLDASGGPPVPLRWGRLAMDGTKPFRRCLHATMAVLRLQEAGRVAPKDAVAARSAAGQAWRHCNAGRPWVHDTELAPRGLQDEFHSCIQLAIDALTLTALRPATDLASARKRISLLHLIVASPVANRTPSIVAVAKQMLATETLTAWVTWRQDPRHNGAPTKHEEAFVSTIASIVMPLVDPDAVSSETKRFVSVGIAAYGLHLPAQEFATVNGGVLAPLAAASTLSSVYSLTATMQQLAAPIALPTVPVPF